MSIRHQQIVAWAAQMGLSEQALRRLLEAESTLPLEAAGGSHATLPFWGDAEDTLEAAPGDGRETFALELGDDPAGGGRQAGRAEAPGEFLGRYEDLGLLGVGGMGEVRQVRDHTLRRVMAMKIIHRELMDRASLVSRFIEEAQIGAQLQHPGVVPVYELGELPDGRHYFTMKQIRGTELLWKIQAVHEAATQQRWRPAADGTSFRDLIRVHQQVCETMAYAHAQGVIHRDLKPENVMIGGFGEVLVVDWGLAKVLGRDEKGPGDSAAEWVETDRSTDDVMKTRMGSVAGTPCYMAPEQAFGRTAEVGTPADIYALGAILYEILSGAPPYQGTSVPEVLALVRGSAPSSLRDRSGSSVELIGTQLQREAPAPVSANRRIPVELVELCERAMAREISERMLDAMEMAEGLKAWLEGAEKRDKGLAEVALAEQMSDEARAADAAADREWRAAETLLRQDGVTSEAGWARWEAYREAAATARRLRRGRERRLQAALVHAPSLEEAHQALGELRVEALIEAIAIGDRAAQERIQQQLSSHLQHLDPSAREALEAGLAAGISDAIAGHRLRRGAIVGRHAQREAVASQLAGGVRLVTLLGTAGVGKTRLALELADALRPQFARVVFCDLTEIHDDMEVFLRLSRALDVRLRDRDPARHLGEVLSEAPTLLILDNLEQLTAAIGPRCSDWLASAADLRILATSRRRLGIEAEVVAPLQPMGLIEGLELFVRRGQAADPSFAPTPDNRARICALVEALDGLPLAIELAAARLNLFTLEELSGRLTERFSLLRSRGRDAQALEGALDWSWGLLEPWAKAALSQASLFRGGFTLSAAEEIIDVGPHRRAPAMFDVLGELVDSCLLREDRDDAAGSRYSLLESIRAYAHEKLCEPGELGPDLQGPEALQRSRERHAAHFGKMGAPAALKALEGFGASERWTDLFRELDNLVAGVGYGSAESAPRCGLAALKALSMKGPVSLGVEIATQALAIDGLDRRERMLLEIERSKCLRISGRMEEAREMVSRSVRPPKALEVGSKAPQSAPQPAPQVPQAEPPAAPVERPDVASVEVTEEPRPEAARLLELGSLELEQGRYDEALRCWEAALTLFQRQANRAGEGQTISNIGLAYKLRGQLGAALERFEQGLAIAREIGDPRSEGFNLSQIGTIHFFQDQHALAIEHYREALDIAWSLDDRPNIGIQFGLIGTVHLKQGEYTQALSAYGTALETFQKIGNKRSEGIQLGNLGSAYSAMGDLPRALEHYQRALSIARALGERVGESVQLGNIGAIHSERGEYERALASYSPALAIAQELGDGRSEGVHHGNIGDALFKLGRSEEAEASFRKAIPICDAFEPVAAGVFRGSLALLLAHRGDLDDARSCLSAGEPLVAPHLEEHVKFIQKKGQVFLIAGDVSGARAALHQARALTAGLDVHEESEMGQALTALAAALEASDDPGDAREDALLEAARLTELGNIAFSQSYNEEALRCWEGALALFRAHAEHKGEGEVLGAISRIHQSLGRSTLFLECSADALAIARAIGDRRVEGQQLIRLADFYQRHSEYALAIEYAQQAIEPIQAIGAKDGEFGLLVLLANVYQEQGQHALAIEHYQRSIALAREIGDRQSEGMVLGNFGSLYARQGEYERALEFFEDALVIAREFGAKHDENRHLGNTGNIYWSRGDYAAARERYVRYLEVSRELEDKLSECHALLNLGSTSYMQGQYDEAVERFSQAASLAREHGFKGIESIQHGELGASLIELGRLDEAEAALREAIRLGDELGQVNAITARGALALLLAQRGEFSEARSLLRVDEVQIASNPEQHVLFLSRRGRALHILGDCEGASADLSRAREAASALNVGADSPTGQAIALLAAAIEGAAP